MPIPAGLIFGWSGTHASIPSGFSRVTALDGRYVKGAPAATNPGGTGGALTHAHSVISHTHSEPHSHTAANSGGPSATTGPFGGSTVAGSNDSHVHTTTVAASAAVNYGSGSGTTATGSNADIKRVELIWIESDGTPLKVPVGASLLYDNTSMPTGYNVPQVWSAFADAYIVAPGTGANGGGTGSAASHTHGIGGHTHSAPGHTHGYSLASQNDGLIATSLAGPERVPTTHTHAGGTSGSTSGTTAAASATTASASTGPLYRRLIIAENVSGLGLDLFEGAIALWLGTLASIPENWNLCDGTLGTQDMRGYYPLYAFSSLGSTGGGNTHNHTALSHSHAWSHEHTLGSPSGAASSVTGANVLTTRLYASTTHTHNFPTDTLGPSTGTGSDSAGIGSANHEPPYTNVAFLRFTGDYTVHPGAASLSIAGQPPTVTIEEDKFVFPPSSTFNLIPRTPTIAVSTHRFADPGAGSLTLAGQTPTVATPQGFTPGSLATALAAFAPEVETPFGPNPGSADLTLTAYPPDVAFTAHVNLTPGPLGLTIATFEPFVTVPLTPGPGLLSLIGFVPTVSAVTLLVVPAGIVRPSLPAKGVSRATRLPTGRVSRATRLPTGRAR